MEKGDTAVVPPFLCICCCPMSTFLPRMPYDAKENTAYIMRIYTVFRFVYSSLQRWVDSATLSV